MGNTKRILSEEKLETVRRDNEEQFLVTEIRYSKGELSGKRGYFLHVGPEGREDRGNGIMMRSFMVGMGVSVFLKPATRFSAKELASFSVPAEQLAQYRQRVLDQLAEREAQNRG